MIRVQGQSKLSALLSPERLTWVARQVVRVVPMFRFGKRVFVFQWHLVKEILERDQDFLIEPVNKHRIDAVCGPFILGMDRGFDRNQQRQRIYSALKLAPLDSLTHQIETSAETQIKLAKANNNAEIDIVNDYARLISAETAANYFGLKEPDTKELMRVLRSVFHETFLNLGNDNVVREKGIAAGQELKLWIDTEVQKRCANVHDHDDVLHYLMESSKAPDKDESITHMLSGLIVGAVDTTATTVANIMLVLMSNAKWRHLVHADRHDSDLLYHWCLEALRVRPHNPLVVRQTDQPTKLGNKTVKAGSTVFALTQAAMQDQRVFNRPASLEKDRDASRYFHFGGGVHECSGRALNRVQIPALIKPLLVNGASSATLLAVDGPFPDHVSVNLEPNS